MTLIIRLFFLSLFLLKSNMAWCQAVPADINKTIRWRLAPIINDSKIEAINFTSHDGMIEVVTDSGIIYTNRSGTYVFNGSIIKVKGKINETDNRWQKLGQIDFKNLPLKDAIKTVNGNGKRVIVTFEDPNCTYCKKLAPEIQKIPDLTVYTFVVPILSAESDLKARAIWCSQEKAENWKNLLAGVKKDFHTDVNCETPNERNLSLYKKLHMSGTPTIFFADNSRMAGYQSAESIEKSLAK